MTRTFGIVGESLETRESGPRTGDRDAGYPANSASIHPPWQGKGKGPASFRETAVKTGPARIEGALLKPGN